VREEQRSQAGCPARDLCDELLGRDTKLAMISHGAGQTWVGSLSHHGVAPVEARC
jgi:hypothetical protein